MFNPSFTTAESVTCGHPDKVCDQISDAILDVYLAQDPMSRVAIETFGAHGMLVIAGEVTSRATVDVEVLARNVYRTIGYTDELRIITNVVVQSPNIAQGVDTGGAGDQGIMYGYATDETPEFMPRASVLAHQLASRLHALRITDPRFSWLRPDGKTQVTLKDGVAQSALVSTQHDANISLEEIRAQLLEHLFTPILGDLSSIECLVNPTGTFILGGFEADTGLTGRKIMVDTYGGLFPHGGGAFSGKDPTKVDRSGAYMARFVAKNLVANGYAKQCLVSVAYAIGRAEPLMVEAVNERGESLRDLVVRSFDFRPPAIIERLGLRAPIYAKTATYGHFGNQSHPWESLITL